MPDRRTVTLSLGKSSLIMPDFNDHILGKVVVSRGRSSKYVRLGVTATGVIRVSAPLFTPMYFIKNLVKKSRSDLQKIIHQYRTSYSSDVTVGKSHRLIIHRGQAKSEITYKKPNIIVLLADGDDILDENLQSKIRVQVAKALRIEAKAHLPRRVEYIAGQNGFSYKKLRFSHARGRWGSCSNDGTISLNIALMKLPFELIDYVIIHELSHIRYLNHSSDFWELVATSDSDYKKHLKSLKNHSPHI